MDTDGGEEFNCLASDTPFIRSVTVMHNRVETGQKYYNTIDMNLFRYERDNIGSGDSSLLRAML